MPVEIEPYYVPVVFSGTFEKEPHDVIVYPDSRLAQTGTKRTYAALKDIVQTALRLGLPDETRLSIAFAETGFHHNGARHSDLLVTIYSYDRPEELEADLRTTQVGITYLRNGRKVAYDDVEHARQSQHEIVLGREAEHRFVSPTWRDYLAIRPELPSELSKEQRWQPIGTRVPPEFVTTAPL